MLLTKFLNFIRVYHKPTKKYLVKPYFDNFDKIIMDFSAIILDETDIGECKNIDEESYIIELWTGEYDINGNKIFENDILRSALTNKKELVFLDDDRIKFKILDIEKTTTQSKDFFDFHINNNYEIIGNLHNNKNLIKNDYILNNIDIFRGE